MIFFLYLFKIIIIVIISPMVFFIYIFNRNIFKNFEINEYICVIFMNVISIKIVEFFWNIFLLFNLVLIYLFFIL
jgi:hypothetical protein